MAKGKYAGIIDKLPRLLGVEPEYQEKVGAIKDNMRADPDFLMQASALAAEYAALRAEKEVVENELYELNLRLEATAQLMTDQFENEGVSSVTLAGGRPVSFYLEPYATVRDKELYGKFCRENADLERQLSLAWMTTNKLTKDRLLAGESEPPGVVCYAKTKVRLGAE